jgi:hypothetical protein
MADGKYGKTYVAGSIDRENTVPVHDNMHTEMYYFTRTSYPSSSECVHTGYQKLNKTKSFSLLPCKLASLMSNNPYNHSFQFCCPPTLTLVCEAT